jgi:hypothetical protein
VNCQNPATAEICAQGRAGQAPQRTPPAAGTVTGPELRIGRPHHKGPSTKHLVRPYRDRCAHTRSFPAVPWWRASTTTAPRSYGGGEPAARLTGPATAQTHHTTSKGDNR